MLKLSSSRIRGISCGIPWGVEESFAFARWLWSQIVVVRVNLLLISIPERVKIVGRKQPRSQNEKLRSQISDFRFVLSVHRMEKDIILPIAVSFCGSLLGRNAGRLLRPGGVSTVCLGIILSAIAHLGQNVALVVLIVGTNILVLSMTATAR